MNGGIMLLDNINITFIDGTEKIYNVIYYNDKGFFLRTEGESLITSLHIKDSKLITNYHSNIYVKSIKDIASVNIEEEWIKKKFPGFYIEGHLLTYDTKMANKYFLDECKKISLYDTGIEAQYGEQLLTLSTCEYSQKNGRFVIVAKKVK